MSENSSIEGCVYLSSAAQQKCRRK